MPQVRGPDPPAVSPVELLLQPRHAGQELHLVPGDRFGQVAALRLAGLHGLGPGQAGELGQELETSLGVGVQPAWGAGGGAQGEGEEGQEEEQSHARGMGD